MATKPLRKAQDYRKSREERPNNADARSGSNPQARTFFAATLGGGFCP